MFLFILLYLNPHYSSYPRPSSIREREKKRESYKERERERERERESEKKGRATEVLPFNIKLDLTRKICGILSKKLQKLALLKLLSKQPYFAIFLYPTNFTGLG